MSRSNISYVELTGKVKALTEKAIRFEPTNQDVSWVPRSLLGFHSEHKLRNCRPGSTVTLYVADFKCDEVGWLPEASKATDEMFMIEDRDDK